MDISCLCNWLGGTHALIYRHRDMKGVKNEDTNGHRIMDQTNLKKNGKRHQRHFCSAFTLVPRELSRYRGRGECRGRREIGGGRVGRRGAAGV